MRCIFTIYSYNNASYNFAAEILGTNENILRIQMKIEILGSSYVADKSRNSPREAEENYVNLKSNCLLGFEYLIPSENKSDALKKENTVTL
jgi:hypothetical protein